MLINHANKRVDFSAAFLSDSRRIYSKFQNQGIMQPRISHMEGGKGKSSLNRPALFYITKQVLRLHRIHEGGFEADFRGVGEFDNMRSYF